MSGRVSGTEGYEEEADALVRQYESIGFPEVHRPVMHLDPPQRRRAMPHVAGLVRHGGAMIMSLRHGPVPPGRRMFEVSAEETTELAAAEGLILVLRLDHQDGILGRPGVSWTRLAFQKVREVP